MMNFTLVLNDFLQQLVPRLVENELLARGQRQYGVRCKLNRFDKFTIHDDLLPVDFFDQDHTATVLTGSSSATSIKFLRRKSISLNAPAISRVYRYSCNSSTVKLRSGRLHSDGAGRKAHLSACGFSLAYSVTCSRQRGVFATEWIRARAFRVSASPVVPTGRLFSIA